MQEEPGSPPSSAYSLLEVEQHFAELVSNVQDHAIFLLNPNGVVISWNAGANRIKGYSAAEIIGQHFSRFYPQEALDRGWPQEELKRASESGRFEDEGWRVRKDGSLFWANVVITALRAEQGDLRGFLKITRDLTERKQAEEKVRQSEERLRLMIESVKDYAIFMLDTEGHVATWNAGAERIKGYTAKEIIGTHFSVFFTSEDLTDGKPAKELHVAATTGRFEDEGWRVRKDKSHFWANVIITSLRDKEGTLRGFVKITRDMTERRQVKALQVADRQKNEFLAMLAHELRNPLAPIRNGVEILKVSRDEAALQQTTEMMERQVVHLVRLVDDLLDMSRIITGKIHLDKEPVEVSVFINRAIEEVQPTIDAGGHELMLSMHLRVDLFERGDRESDKQRARWRRRFDVSVGTILTNGHDPASDAGIGSHQVAFLKLVHVALLLSGYSLPQSAAVALAADALHLDVLLALPLTRGARLAFDPACAIAVGAWDRLDGGNKACTGAHVAEL